MLLIDSGNSAIKCRLITAGATLDDSFELYRPHAWQQFSAYLSQLEVEYVYLASVAAADTQQRIRDQIQQCTNAQLHSLNTLAQLGHIKNGYHNHQQLGVDRWLALLGASAETTRDAIIIDAGSAITIDLLSQRNGHLGGAILPGFNCDLVRFRQIFGTIDFSRLNLDDANLPGRSTEACLRPQHLPANSAHIEQYIALWKPLLDPAPEILLCGQDAHKITPLRQHPYRIIPDLVFNGMLKQIEGLG